MHNRVAEWKIWSVRVRVFRASELCPVLTKLLSPSEKGPFRLNGDVVKQSMRTIWCGCIDIHGVCMWALCGVDWVKGGMVDPCGAGYEYEFRTLCTVLPCFGLLASLWTSTRTSRKSARSFDEAMGIVRMWIPQWRISNI